MTEVAEKLRQQIIRDEGRVDHAYQDSMEGKCDHCGQSRGYWTIGVGHLIDDRKRGYLPDFIIDTLLEYDIAKVQRELIAALPWFIELDPPRQAVLVNMGFNLGVAGLLKFAKTLAAIKTGSYHEAAIHMLDSKWARQVGVRAQRLATQMETGRWI
jgi:lysozyme